MIFWPSKFLVTNHGVNRNLIDKAEKVALEFFNKPTNFKTAFNNDNQKLLDTGYFPAKLDGKGTVFS